MNTTESTFMTLFREGDATVFRDIKLQYSKQLYLFVATNYFKEHWKIQEMVAKAFASLWLYKDQMRSPDHIRNWLFKTTENACLDGLKDMRRRGAYLISVPDHAGFMSESASRDAEADHRMIQSELQALVALEVDRLPVKLREVINLYFMEGVSVREIAVRLSIGEQTVYDRMKEAKKRLKISDLKNIYP